MHLFLIIYIIIYFNYDILHYVNIGIFSIYYLTHKTDRGKNIF